MLASNYHDDERRWDHSPENFQHGNNFLTLNSTIAELFHHSSFNLWQQKGTIEAKAGSRVPLRTYTKYSYTGFSVALIYALFFYRHCVRMKWALRDMISYKTSSNDTMIPRYLRLNDERQQLIMSPK